MDGDELFRALVSPYRREILNLLKTGDMNAGDIAEHFQISQPSISRHLDILRHSGLVTSRRMANQIIYSLEPHAFRECLSQLEKIFAPG